MILFISGFQSTHKEWIPRLLRERTGQDDVVYYVLKNVISEDLAALRLIIGRQPEYVTIIGHSTGGFLALVLLREYSNVVGVHAINPAWNLLYSLDRNPKAAKILEERDIIKYHFLMNDDYFTNFKPVSLYQGQLDDRVDMKYNEELISRVCGHHYRYPSFGHRFNEAELSVMLEDMIKYIGFNY